MKQIAILILDYIFELFSKNTKRLLFIEIIVTVLMVLFLVGLL